MPDIGEHTIHEDEYSVMTVIVLRQRALNGDARALDELVDRHQEFRRRADDHRRRADDHRRRADDLRKQLDELQSRSYVYNLTHRCTIQYIRMRPCYMTS